MPCDMKKCMKCGRIEHFIAQCRSNSLRPRSHYDATHSNLNCQLKNGKPTRLQAYKTTSLQVDVAKRHNVKKWEIFAVNSPIGCVCCTSVHIDDCECLMSLLIHAQLQI